MVLALNFNLMCLTELNILLRFHVVLCPSFAIVGTLWQWSRLEIGLVTLHWSAISQKQFTIIILISIIIIMNELQSVFRFKIKLIISLRHNFTANTDKFV